MVNAVCLQLNATQGCVHRMHKICVVIAWLDIKVLVAITCARLLAWSECVSDIWTEVRCRQSVARQKRTERMQSSVDVESAERQSSRECTSVAPQCTATLASNVRNLRACLLFIYCNVSSDILSSFIYCCFLLWSQTKKLRNWKYKSIIRCPSNFYDIIKCHTFQSKFINRWTWT